jgi:hypothetical protein
VLGSFIDYESSGVAAYDGQTLHRVFVDEIGKTVECSVDERMNTLNIKQVCILFIACSLLNFDASSWY